MTRIHFLGAAGTVTGSKYLLETSTSKVLVDCGLFQGPKELRERNWRDLPLAVDSLDAVVLTHAHIDHTGYLPRLVRGGFRGPVFCTTATRDLCEILLRDAAYLQEEAAERANRRGYTKHAPALPLFTRADAELALELFMPIEDWDGLATTIADGVRCTFHRAGHILGAAWLSVEIEGTRIVFSGDIGRPNDAVMKAPAPLKRADVLVLESTYGDRTHPPGTLHQSLAEVVNRTVARRGIVVIPAFAVGRSQALMHIITELKSREEIPDVPVFLNSPMAINASDLYCRWHDEHRLTSIQCRAMCDDVTYVREARDSRVLNARTEPAIIISASGMATGGRILHHLKAFAPNPSNTLLFCGYQAEGTRGRAIVDGAPRVKIHGSHVPIRAEVVSLTGLSAHADYVELGDWLAAIEKPPRATFLTHGEPAPQLALARHLHSRFDWDVIIPRLGDVADV